ncbi:MAG: FecR domain-containing protein [Verrucomicrobia bacterium]|nr:FecR domain-containing protein [Verrucomicrobiota bacterium]
MVSSAKTIRALLLTACCGFLATQTQTTHAQPSTSATNQIRILEFQGEVAVSPAGANWQPAQIHQLLSPADHLRTGPNSRCALRWSDQSIISFGASTELEILPPHDAAAQSGLQLVHGILSFFHRDQPGRIRIITRGAVAGVEGTELVLAVNDAGQTTLSVVDGKVRFANDQATLVLTNGQQAVAAPNQAPARTAGFIANNLLQWCFYYPAVLDLADLPLTDAEQTILADSLAAYRAGDLLAALAKYPAARQPASDAEHVYHAALLLSVGEVEKTETELAALTAPGVFKNSQRLAAALRQLIAAVKRQPNPSSTKPQLATEFLADSYFEQSRAIRETSLQNALDCARQAANLSPKSGFAWARVAELEFSFGRTKNALAALEKSLALAPRNAQALALKGFVLAARNETREAVAWFDRALAVDAALGNAWLGRGLCKIKRGDAAGGREDLLVAAALEPQRAELRSYLGKAYLHTGDEAHAAKELALAKKLDPKDPTAWLYSALLHQQKNLINDAIRDLEKSKALNGNRSVYRSQLLLDQDQAARSANLASVYRDAGMTDVSVREAGRAVNSDYANYAAHNFLANSYEQLRDVNGVNLRYETASQNEYLLANLLAPVSAGLVSPTLSQAGYSKLFEHNRLGLISDTEYLSRGAWTESAAQYGVFDNFSYAFESYYHADPGQRYNGTKLNNDNEQRQLSLTLKQQLTPQDTIFLNVQQNEKSGGDLAETYSGNPGNPSLRFRQDQTPNLSLGYHHEWSPGVHTLFLAERLVDDLSFFSYEMPSQMLTFFGTGGGDPIYLAAAGHLDLQEHVQQKLEIYSTELQQIWQTPRHNTVVGARLQYGHFHTQDRQSNPSPDIFSVPGLPYVVSEDNTALFHRMSLYGYHQWQIFEPLQLSAGLTYDSITCPENSYLAQNIYVTPIADRQKTSRQLSPKAGFIWTPAEQTTVRFAYTRSLGGAQFDQNHQIEPSQVAGFVQSYRSIIPESVGGGSPGAQFETFDLSLEQKFSTGTYLGLSGQILNSKVDRLTGAYNWYADIAAYPDITDPGDPRAYLLLTTQPGLRETLDYQEQSLLLTVNQLLGKEWAVGASYRISKAVLHDDFPDVPPVGTAGVYYNDFHPRQHTEGILQQVNLFAVYNHPCGFFAKAEAIWNGQDNADYTPALAAPYGQDDFGLHAPKPGDDFWQFNAYAGYRFFHRKAEVRLALLNIGDQDYNLSPLNFQNVPTRRRTLAVSFRLNF